MTCLLKTYVYSGMRYEECRFLEWTDIDYRHNVVKIRPKKVTCKRELPVKDIELIKSLIETDPSKPAFKESDIDKIKHCVNLHIKDDFLRIKAKDFDFKKGILHYVEVFEWEPKATVGDVCMHKDLVEIFRRLEKQKTSNFVFPAQDGGYWRFKLLPLLKKLVAAAGISGERRVHDLRHTTGFMLRRAGVSLETICELLRHASLEQTMIYAQYTLEEGQKAMDNFPSI